MNIYNEKRVLSIFLTLIWMAVIFILSDQPANESNELSLKAANTIIKTIEKVNLIETETEIKRVDMIEQSNYIVRKYAHVWIYLFLGILLFNAIRVYKYNGFKHFIYTLLLCIVYAISDEFHQLFVPGRSGKATDVLIDSIGSLIGISMYVLVTNSIKIFKTNDNLKD